jgi:hypothetical protein
MTELEKKVQEHFNRFAKMEPMLEESHELCYKEGFKEGYEAAFTEALKPEHMKLTPEVKGLIKVLKKASPKHDSVYTPDCTGCNFEILKLDALKPFEEGGAND